MTLHSGDLFSAELSKLRTSNTASVKHGNMIISVGPVTCEDGTYVQLKYLGERKTQNSTSNYAVCLTDDAIDKEEYHEYLTQVIDLLTSDGVPATDEVTYVEVSRFDGDHAVAEVGDQDLVLGPIHANVGDFVKVKGVQPSAARVLDTDLHRTNYDLEFALLSGQYHKLPIDTGEEYQSAISGYDGESYLCHVKGTPIKLPGCDGELGQKIDIRIDRFEDQAVIGEVLTLYDEVSRIKDPGHWARMQWLQESGFAEDTFETFVATFIGLEKDALPDETDRIQESLIGEAFRQALVNKARESTAEFPRAHVSGVRHWVYHKLRPVLGETASEEDEDDHGWLLEALNRGAGPTLTFLGDVLSLSHGYYAPGQTRAVMINSSEAVLISGHPTEAFLDRGLNVEVRGLTRVILGTSETELGEEGIPVQTRSEYVADDVYDQQYLVEFLDGKTDSEWQGTDEWTAYVGEAGYGFNWREEPLEVDDGSGRLISLWKEPVEYGGDEYHLRIRTDDGPQRSVRIPRQQYKQFCLLIDHLAGRSRMVRCSPLAQAGERHLACSFPPPRAQIRWLNAVGAKWRGPRNNQLHWVIPEGAANSVVNVFEQLPVEVRTTDGDHQ